MWHILNAFWFLDLKQNVFIQITTTLHIKETARIHEKFDIKIEYNGKDIRDNDINIIYNKYGYIDMNTDKLVSKKLMCF